METTTSNLSSNPAAMGKNVANNIDNATSGVHHAIDKASEAARPAVDRVAASAHNVVDKLAGVAASAAETLGEKGEQLKEAQARATEASRDYVRENPLTSIGIAVAVGFLLSRLVSSR